MTQEVRIQLASDGIGMGTNPGTLSAALYPKEVALSILAGLKSFNFQQLIAECLLRGRFVG